MNKYLAEATLPLAAPKLSDSVFEMFSMKGKTAVVTGASGGIGHAVAQAVRGILHHRAQLTIQ
jgi:sorbose reductase